MRRRRSRVKKPYTPRFGPSCRRQKRTRRSRRCFTNRRSRPTRSSSLHCSSSATTDFPLPNNWTTITNGAAFGADYFTRTAVAKSSIFVNKAHETRYFYQELDASGARLNGANRYTVTYPKGQLPPVRGFWSLTLYNERHFFFPNDLKRYSLGTKNKDLKTGADGSLTIYVQPDPPEESKRSNWIPAPKGNFSLHQRAYWPEQAILDGKWTPPAVARAG